MTTQQAHDTVYAMGYAAEERQRLVEQSVLYGPATRQLFLAAGIGSGMRVLDVGCGVGDVSLLAAELVGPDGRVVGVDRDLLALGTAQARAREAGITTISFVQGDLHELAFDAPFDAAVGRFILLHLGDPVAAVRRVAGHVRPGGVIAFQEQEGATAPPFYPALALYERVGAWLTETMRRARVDLHMGLKLYQVFQEAGLPAPALRAPTRSSPPGRTRRCTRTSPTPSAACCPSWSGWVSRRRRRWRSRRWPSGCGRRWWQRAV